MIAVTKLIDLLDKPAIVGWANKLGLNGVDLKNYYKEVQNDGNKNHNEIELYLKDGIKFTGYQLLEDKLKDFEVIGVEETIKNDFLIGRIDLILKHKKSNLIYVCDFKRNKNIYLKTKLQLSCYKEMLEADKIAYINTDTFDIVEINIITSKYYEIVKRLYQIHLLLINLNERL
jgi:hypothetical protein